MEGRERGCILFCFCCALSLCFVCCPVVLLNLVLCLREIGKGRGQMPGHGEIGGIGMHDVKPTRNQQKQK